MRWKDVGMKPVLEDVELAAPCAQCREVEPLYDLDENRICSLCRALNSLQHTLTRGRKINASKVPLKGMADLSLPPTDQ